MFEVEASAHMTPWLGGALRDRDDVTPFSTPSAVCNHLLCRDICDIMYWIAKHTAPVHHQRHDSHLIAFAAACRNVALHSLRVVTFICQSLCQMFAPAR